MAYYLVKKTQILHVFTDQNKRQRSPSSPRDREQREYEGGEKNIKKSRNAHTADHDFNFHDYKSSLNKIFFREDTFLKRFVLVFFKLVWLNKVDKYLRCLLQHLNFNIHVFFIPFLQKLQRV